MAGVEAVVQHCNYVPMALAVVAKVLRHEPGLWNDIGQTVKQALLTGVAVGRNPADGQTMHNAMHLSFSRLSPEQQQALLCIVSKLRARHAQEVAACFGGDVLDALVARGLLQLEARGGSAPLVEVHEAVDMLCLQLLEERPKAQVAEKQMVDTEWYVSLTQQPPGAGGTYLHLADAVWLSMGQSLLPLSAPVWDRVLHCCDLSQEQSSSPRAAGSGGSDLIDAPRLRVLQLTAPRYSTVRLQALPQLRLVTLRSLPYLARLHLTQLSSLEHLEISACSRLTLLDGLAAHTTLQRLHLTSLPHLPSLPDVGFLLHLRQLYLSGLWSVTTLGQLSKLQALEQVQMRGMGKLGEAALAGLKQLTALQDVELEGVGRAGDLPEMKEVASLTRLRWRKERFAPGQTW